MNILQANASDWTITGGTGVAVNWLDRGLRRHGINSRILCAVQQLGSPLTVVKPNPLPAKIIEAILKRLLRQVGLNECHRVLSSRLAMRLPAYQEADLIHFHCIFAQLFSYLSLPVLTRDKPGVFTIHDMWAFTGHCTYSYQCARYQTSCGRCPHPEVSLAIKRDATHLEWKLKRWAYERSNLTIIAPSRWQAEQARHSILNRFPIHYIPYGVDIEIYRPLERVETRRRLGIPGGKKVLLTGALHLSDFRKGSDLMVKAIKGLPESLKHDLVVIAFGEGSSRVLRELDVAGIDLGYIDDDYAKAAAYSAADLFICPTRADNSPLVLYESLACGTPVVAFRVGGVPDLVRPGETGYLAAPEDIRDLREGIVSLLVDEPARIAMGRRARELIVKEFTLDQCVRRHIELYGQVLAGPLASPAPTQADSQRLVDKVAADVTRL